MNPDKALIFDHATQQFVEVDRNSVNPDEIIETVGSCNFHDVVKKSMADLNRTDIDGFRSQKRMPVVVVLDNIRSLNNIGSIFRTCDGFACTAIAICGITATPPSPQIHKTALGAENSVPWQYFATTKEAVEYLRAQGYIITCLEQVHGSHALQNLNPEPGKAYALIAGNEVDGVDPEIVNMCDEYIEIPQSGTKHSLNVAVATAVTLWEFYKHSDVIGKV